eukprot:Clim_evm10s157 gene=Clim_evmTU10s157
MQSPHPHLQFPSTVQPEEAHHYTETDQQAQQWQPYQYLSASAPSSPVRHLLMGQDHQHWQQQEHYQQQNPVSTQPSLQNHHVDVSPTRPPRPSHSTEVPPPKYFHAGSVTANGSFLLFGGCLDTEGRKRCNRVHEYQLEVPSLFQLAARSLLRDERVKLQRCQHRGIMAGVSDGASSSSLYDQSRLQQHPMMISAFPKSYRGPANRDFNGLPTEIVRQIWG